MSIDKQPREALELKIKSLEHEIGNLNKYKYALKAQEKLFHSILIMRSVSSGKLMLRSILIEIIDICVKLLNAEAASLFLLSPKGVIIDSILARGPTIKEEKEMLIGQVLKKGLAGWVARYRQIALVEDTLIDERWINLPEETYTVRSALAIPFLRGRLLLGILTLTHSEPKKFSQSMLNFMKMYSPSLTIALDIALDQVNDSNP